jgi:hypothetical protein
MSVPLSLSKWIRFVGAGQISELALWKREKLDLLEMDDREMLTEANRIVKSILDEHQVKPLANDLIEKSDAIIAKYEDIVGD